MSEPVKLTVAPNGPIAEVVCAKLRGHGIDAFYRDASPWGGDGLDATYPAEIYVRAEDLQRAKKLI